MTPSLTIQIVGWNSARHLRHAADALAGINADNIRIRYIDNGSSDESVSLIQTILPHADIVELQENRGFASAHNVGFSMCDTEFVLTHDPDVQLDMKGIRSLLACFEDSRIGAVQGKLLRASDPSVIDSAGIVLSATLNGVERGAGERDIGQYDSPTDIIAPTGACALYRMTALRDVAHNDHTIFDEQFFSYKEDVDLGWRLHRKGWRVAYEPIRMGTHARTLGRRGIVPWFLNPFALYPRLRSPRTRYSLRNYVWMIVKNASFKELITHTPFIFARLAYWDVLIILYPPLIRAWVDVALGWNRIVQKRYE